MTLEQRVEALEKAVAKLTLPSATAEEMAKVMRDIANETIKNARRPGGALFLSNKNATQNSLIAFEVKSGVVHIKPALISASDSV